MSTSGIKLSRQEQSTSLPIAKLSTGHCGHSGWRSSWEKKVAKITDSLPAPPSHKLVLVVDVVIIMRMIANTGPTQ